MLRIEIDMGAGALYIHISDKGVSYTKGLTSEVLLDYAEDDTLVGLELLSIPALSLDREV